MSRIKKSVLSSVVAVAMLFSACSAQQLETTKVVYSKVAFYVGLAKSIIQVAEARYSDNDKVSTALAATRNSLSTVESLLASIMAGVEKDESKMDAAMKSLIVDVFNLIEAIREAKKVQ